MTQVRDGDLYDLKISFIQLAKKLSVLFKERKDQKRPEYLSHYVRQEIVDADEYGVVKEQFEEIMSKIPRHDYEEMTDETESEMLLEAAFRMIKFGTRPHVSQNDVEKVWQEIIRCFEATPSKSRVRAYLEGFHSDAKCIRLDKNFRIRRMDLIEQAFFSQKKKDRFRHLEANFILETYPTVEVGSLSFNLEDSSKDKPRIVVEYVPGIREKLSEIVSAIRIWNPTSAGIETYSLEIQDKKDDNGVSTFLHLEKSLSPEVFPAYYSCRRKNNVWLMESEIGSFLKFWRCYVKTTESKRFKRVIRRFNVAITSDSVEDELVDLIICIETLLKTMSFKAILLASGLAISETYAPSYVMNELEKAYRLRNAVTHGGGFDDKQIEDLDNLLPIVAHLIRNAIILTTSIDQRLEIYIREVSLNSDTRASMEKLIKSQLQPNN